MRLKKEFLTRWGSVGGQKGTLHFWEESVYQSRFNTCRNYGCLPNQQTLRGPGSVINKNGVTLIKVNETYLFVRKDNNTYKVSLGDPVFHRRPFDLVLGTQQSLRN